MKNTRNKKINDAFNKNINNYNNIFSEYNNYFDNNIFSENNNHFNNKNLFNIDDDDEDDELERKVFSSNQSPKNKLNLCKENNFYNNSIEYLINTIKVNQLKKKNNNTLIFPNNINQNIFNCTITSREFKNLNDNRKIDYFTKINNNKSFYTNKSIKILNNQILSRNNKTENYNISKKKINRSSSIPEMINRNKSDIYLLNQKYNTNKMAPNSLPKNYNYINYNNYITNKNNNKINNNINNKNVLKLCYKVKEFINILNKNNFDKNSIFNEKKNDLNTLINNIIKTDRSKNNENNNNINISQDKINNNRNISQEIINKNRNISQEISNNRTIPQSKNNNQLTTINIELMKNNKILIDKIKSLENKIKEKDIYINNISKNNNNPINQNNKILIEKDNKISELNKNILYLEKENNELKDNIVKLKNINEQAEKLSQMIIDKDLEIEQLKLKKNELKNITLDSKKEIKLKNDNVIQNINKELISINDINNSIDNLKNELYKKEKIINELNNSIKTYEEKKLKENVEKNILKEENLELKKKVEEFKNNLIEKNRTIQKMNVEIEELKKKENNIDDAKKSSQLVMEIATLKKINSTLNKKINELKKKSQKGSGNTNNNNYIQNDTSSSHEVNVNKLNEKIQTISDQNKDLSEQIHKISFEKQQLEISNNDKSEQIKKMQNIIDNLNTKLNDYQNNNNRINNVNKDNIIINKKENESKSLTLTENSFTNEIVNYDSKEIKIRNIEDYKKENEELNQKYKNLKNQFNKFKNESQIEISIYKNEFESLKKEMKKDKDDFSPDKYNILCDKIYEKLQWYLLIPKEIKFENNYNNLIWVGKPKIKNVDKFNKFETEIEVQNNIITNYIKKLEQKEEIISKLNSKLNDRNINLTNDINSNYYLSSHNLEGGISLEKYNILLNKLNDAEEKFHILQQENIKLKEKRKNHKKHNKIEENTEGSNYLGYNKHYVLNVKEDNMEDNKIINSPTNNLESAEDNENEEIESEDYSETDSELSELKNELENTKIELNRLTNECKILENKIKVLRESSSNLLIKINIPKKYKDEIKEILKLFDFTESEILFIVDKKKQYY